MGIVQEGGICYTDLEALISVAELKAMLRLMQIEDAKEVQSKDAKEQL